MTMSSPRSSAVRRWSIRAAAIVVVSFGSFLDVRLVARSRLAPQAPTARASEVPPARLAYQRAIEKVDALERLRTLVSDEIDAAREAAATGADLRRSIEASHREVVEAVDSVNGMSSCLQNRSRAINLGVRTIEQFRRAAHDSLTQASSLASTSAPTPTRTVAPAENAFVQRFERKQELIALVAAVPAQMDQCTAQLVQTKRNVGGTATAFTRVHRGVRDLLSRLARVRQTALLADDQAMRVRSRGWLSPSPDTAPFPGAPSLRLLRLRIDALDGVARLELREPHPDASTALRDYQDAALRLAVEDDARQFLELLARTAAITCDAQECRRLQDNADSQRSRVEEMSRDAEFRGLEVRRTIQVNPGLGVFGSETSSWADVQSGVEKTFEQAIVEARAIVALSEQRTAALQKALTAALAQAIAERRSAYERVFGVPQAPDAIVQPPSPAAPAPPPPPPPTPPPPPKILTRHAFEVLTLRASESDRYGAYTYVVLPIRTARPEYAALLSAIVKLTPAASPTASTAVRNTTNLFVIPGNRAEPIDPDEMPAFAREISNYDWSRALSLVQIACDGVLSTPRVLQRFQRSPGPFLLTLPVPIERARGVTQLLLADLSGYPASGFDDLVKSYQNDLVATFPTTQTVWTPPWEQRLALALVRIGASLGGQNFVALAR